MKDIMRGKYDTKQFRRRFKPNKQIPVQKNGSL